MQPAADEGGKNPEQTCELRPLRWGQPEPRHLLSSLRPAPGSGDGPAGRRAHEPGATSCVSGPATGCTSSTGPSPTGPSSDAWRGSGHSVPALRNRKSPATALLRRLRHGVARRWRSGPREGTSYGWPPPASAGTAAARGRGTGLTPAGRRPGGSCGPGGSAHRSAPGRFPLLALLDSRRRTCGILPSVRR